MAESGAGSTMTWSGAGDLPAKPPSQFRERSPSDRGRYRPVRSPVSVEGRVSNDDDDDASPKSDPTRERNGRPSGQTAISSRSSRDSDRAAAAGVYGDYDDVDLEIEDIQEYLVSSVENFIVDVSEEYPEPPSLLTELNIIHSKIINPTDTSIPIPIYFKKWMIDQAVNGRQGRVTNPIESPEIKNIGLYDYFLNNTDTRLQELLLPQLVMYILALRTGDLSFLADIASEIKPKLV